MSITLPTNLPAGDRQTRRVTGITLPEPTVYVDQDGDVWKPIGRTPSGDVLLACPEPLNPEDRGEGESFAWTLALVEAGFGPLECRSAVSS